MGSYTFAIISKKYMNHPDKKSKSDLFKFGVEFFDLYIISLCV